MTKLERLIWKCITSDAARLASPAAIELERQADDAYALTKKLIASGEVRVDLLPAAFRCLAAICKHQGIRRRSDLLNIIIPYTHHADRAVRTAAAHQVVWSGFSESRARQVGLLAPTTDSLAEAVGTALRMGVEPQFQDSFEHYLSSRSPPKTSVASDLDSDPP